MRILAVLMCVAVLGACGADGEPEPPEAEAQVGLRVSGTASFGVSF